MGGACAKAPVAPEPELQPSGRGTAADKAVAVAEQAVPERAATVPRPAAVVAASWNTTGGAYVQAVAPEPMPAVAPGSDFDARLTTLRSRPVRAGAWCIVHRSALDDCDYADSFDPWEEFFSLHPNGDDFVKEFSVVQLTPGQRAEQAHRLRLASYRWDNVKAIDGSTGGEFCMNANYRWFLEYIAENGCLGWMDFIANMVANVPVAETVAYMGALYAHHVTVADWMFEPERLTAALTRAWIFQETAFGAFDRLVASQYMQGIRTRALRSIPTSEHGGDPEAMLAFLIEGINLAQLLYRRGWFQVFQTLETMKHHDETHYDEGEAGSSTKKMADRLTRRVAGDFRWECPVSSQQLWNECDRASGDFALFERILNLVSKGRATAWNAAFHVFDFFSRIDEAEFKLAFECMLDILTTPTFNRCSSSQEFFLQFGDSLIMAYGSCGITYEIDRITALTSVGLAVANSRYYQVVPLDATGFLRECWSGVGYDNYQCAQKDRATMGANYSIVPSIRAGERLAGIGSMTGSLLNDYFGSHNFPHGFYTDSRGMRVRLSVSPSQLFRITFVPEESLWKSDDGDGVRYEVFVCNPPPCYPKPARFIACRDVDADKAQLALIRHCIVYDQETIEAWPEQTFC